MNFLTIVSLLLHAISISAIALLYYRISVSGAKHSIDSRDDEIKEQLQSFVDEIERGNDHLYQKLLERMAEQDRGAQQQVQQLNEKMKNIESIFPPSASDIDGNEPLQQNSKAESSLVKERYDQVTQLYLQGFNMEQIAHTLNIGKGEISMIINLINKRRD